MNQTELADRAAALIRTKLGYVVNLGPVSGVANQTVPVLCMVTPYTLRDDDLNGQDLKGLQVRLRGREQGGNRVLWDAQDDVKELLTTHAVEGTVHCWRATSSPVTLDAANRPEVFDSYYFHVDRLGQTG